jgi:transposase
VLTDAAGVPLVVQTTPANTPDQRQLPALLGALPPVQGPRGRPRTRPRAVVGDRAYGTAEMIAFVAALHMACLLARRGDPAHGSGLGKWRYEVERTQASFSHIRRLRVSYEREGVHFQAFHELAACLLICSRIKHYQT